MKRSVVAVLAGCSLFATIGAAAALGPSPRKLTVLSTPAPVPLSSCTLTPVADSYVDAAPLSAGSNFGTAVTLSVRSSSLGDRRAFVRFDLSQCPEFPNARVTAATLYLLATSAAAGRTYDLHRVTAAWGETSITSSNQPAVAGAASSSAATAVGPMSWPVTSDVASFVAGGATNFGWRIRDRTEGSLVAQTSTFGSQEDGTPAQRPRLEIDYYP